MSMPTVQKGYLPALGEAKKQKARSLLLERLKPIRTVVRGIDYEDDHASLCPIADAKMLAAVKQLVREKKALEPRALFVVGIGGSNLGTMAVADAVLGRDHNQFSLPKLYFADTVDANSMRGIDALLEDHLRRKEQVLIAVISKTGSTTETIANAEILIRTLRRYRKDHHRYVVMITAPDSTLEVLAKQERYAVLNVPRNVGGRYSVFSAVGLFPLGIMGISLDAFMKGARAMQVRCLSSSRSNPAVRLAVMHVLLMKKRYNVTDLFVFGNDLESVGRWYRQLVGESLGKEKDLAGKKVYTGMTPTFSVGSTDLHSVGQLYLGGPFDKIHTFVTVAKSPKLLIPLYPAYDAIVHHLQGKPLHAVMRAIEQGVFAAFRKQKRAHVILSLDDRDAHSIGALLSLFVHQIIFMGHLQNISPFDQPNVDSYKEETRRILAKQR